jgi:hypothetical protein
MLLAAAFMGAVGLVAIPGFLVWFRVATRHAPWTPLAERIAAQEADTAAHPVSI